MKLSKNKLRKFLSGTLAFGAVAMMASLPARAANLTAAKLLLSSSRPYDSASSESPLPGVSVGYTFTFTPASSYTMKCMDITYSTSANTFASATNVPANMSATANPATLTSTKKDGGADLAWTLTNTSANYQKVTDATGVAVINTSVMEVVLAAMRNPDAQGTYYAKIRTFTADDCTGAKDDVVIAWRTQNGVVVSATIDPSLTFTVAGLNPGDHYKEADFTANAANVVSAGCSATATAVAFPSPMTYDTDYTCGQSLLVGTNAANGYQVTLRGTHTATQFMKSTLNELTDHSGVNGTPAAWVSGDTEAFGYTTDDAALSTGPGAADRFSTTDKWAKVPIATVPVEVAYNTVPVSETTKVGYRLRFRAVTKAGQYKGTVVYVATPTF